MVGKPFSIPWQAMERGGIPWNTKWLPYHNWGLAHDPDIQIIFLSCVYMREGQDKCCCSSHYPNGLLFFQFLWNSVAGVR